MRRDHETATALVTGASSGIGLEIARLLARDGHRLVVVARDADRLNEAARELAEAFGSEVLPLAADLSDPEAVDRLTAELDRRGEEIDVLVNNAGFSVYGPYVETDGESERRLMNVNMMALARLTKHVVPGMVSRGHGRVLNIGSTGSFAPGPLNAVYCASKAFVLSFTEAIAEELRGTGVTVTALCPGPTSTGFAKRAGASATRMFRSRVDTAANVASVGYHAMMGGRRVVVPGLFNAALAFSVRLSPRAMVTSVSRLMMSEVEAAR